MAEDNCQGQPHRAAPTNTAGDAAQGNAVPAFRNGYYPFPTTIIDRAVRGNALDGAVVGADIIRPNWRSQFCAGKCHPAMQEQAVAREGDRGRVHVIAGAMSKRLPRCRFSAYSFWTSKKSRPPEGKETALRKMTASGGQGSGRPTDKFGGAVRRNAVPAFWVVQGPTPT